MEKSWTLYLSALQLRDMLRDVSQDGVIRASRAGGLPLGARLGSLTDLLTSICSVLASYRETSQHCLSICHQHQRPSCGNIHENPSQGKLTTQLRNMHQQGTMHTQWQKSRIKSEVDGFATEMACQKGESPGLGRGSCWLYPLQQ